MANKTHKPLVTLTTLFNIFIHVIYSTLTICYIQIMYCHHDADQLPLTRLHYQSKWPG